MPHVVALYRYPVKGLTPESRDSLTVQADGRIEGDRVLGFRFHDTPEADDAWSSKHGMLALVNTPGLARLQVQFHMDSLLRARRGAGDEVPEGRLSLSLGGRVLADEALDDAGRGRLCDSIAEYALRLDDNALTGHPTRLPLRLVGDARQSRYQDSPEGLVSLHARETLRSVGQALGDRDISEVRFRSNIAIESIDPWAEHDWAGRTLRIGSATFQVKRSLVRCLATHANPINGARDLPVVTTLTRVFGQKEPVFAIYLATNIPGDIHVGDEVTVED
jgi:uncharacterized protein YcbX